MTPYLIIYVASIILAFFSQAKIPQILRKLLIVFLILTLSYLLLIRDSSIGTDTDNYITIFDTLGNDITAIATLTALSIEPGFLLFSYVFKSIFENNYIVLFCFAIIFYTCYVQTAVKSNLNMVLFIAALFSYTSLYLMSFNILRQCMALALIFFGSRYILVGSNKKFIVTCLLAATFHYSALICLLFIPIHRFRHVLYKFWFVVMAVVISTSGIALTFLGSINERYSGYVASSEDMSLPSFTFFSFYLFIFIFAILGIKIIKQNLRDEFKFYTIIYTVYISFILFFYISGLTNQGLSRITLYFAWPSIFIIDFALRSIDNKNSRYVFNILIFSFLSLFFIYVLSLKGDAVIPFQTNNEISFF